MEIKVAAKKMKLSAPVLAASAMEQRNRALDCIAVALRAHEAEIFEANRKDMEYAESKQIAQSIQKRLKYDENKLRDIANRIAVTMPVRPVRPPSATPAADST